jgi:predicted aspartyl protease
MRHDVVWRWLVALLPCLPASAWPNAAVATCQVERQASLPVTFDGFMPTVEVSINGHPVNIGVDTGAQGTLLTPQIVDSLRLTRDTQRFTTAIGAAGRRLVSNAIPDSFQFAGVDYAGKSFSVIEIGQPQGGASRPGADMAGLIGADLLSRYDLDIDMPHRRLSLYRVRDCTKLAPPWDGAFMTVPLSLAHAGRPMMPVEMNGVVLSALFDTGARGNTLSSVSGSRIGVTAGDGATARLARAARFRVGDELFADSRLGVIDLPAFDADMLIGEDYMQTRRFWLSYATAVLFIQPGLGWVSGR